MKDEMIILTRTFDMLLWILPKVERFPRAYRHTVCRRMAESALNFQEALFIAQSQGMKQRYQSLIQCDVYLNHLRLYLRLAYHWHWLSDGQYQHISRMITEIGRLLGGWLKQTHNKLK